MKFFYFIFTPLLFPFKLNYRLPLFNPSRFNCRLLLFNPPRLNPRRLNNGNYLRYMKASPERHFPASWKCLQRYDERSQQSDMLHPLFLSAFLVLFKSNFIFVLIHLTYENAIFIYLILPSCSVFGCNNTLSKRKRNRIVFHREVYLSLKFTNKLIFLA